MWPQPCWAWGIIIIIMCIIIIIIAAADLGFDLITLLRSCAIKVL